MKRSYQEAEALWEELGACCCKIDKDAVSYQHYQRSEKDKLKGIIIQMSSVSIKMTDIPFWLS